MGQLRLRQLVIAANQIETADQLQRILALGKPFVDIGVGAFGLTNAVYAIGDQFLEVVVPTTQDAPARRFLDRNGQGGYMAIFQVPDIQATRNRVDGMSMRRVWNADFQEIAASHIHPADIGGAIVSFDQPSPPESWKWGGPDWNETAIAGALTGATLTSPNPEALATRWAEALDGDLSDDTTLSTSDGPVVFENGDKTELQAFHLRLDDPEDVLSAANDEGCVMSEQGFWLAGVHFVVN